MLLAVYIRASLNKTVLIRSWQEVNYRGSDKRYDSNWVECGHDVKDDNLIREQPSIPGLAPRGWLATERVLLACIMPTES